MQVLNVITQAYDGLQLVVDGFELRGDDGIGLGRDRCLAPGPGRPAAFARDVASAAQLQKQVSEMGPSVSSAQELTSYRTSHVRLRVCVWWIF